MTDRNQLIALTRVLELRVAKQEAVIAAALDHARSLVEQIAALSVRLPLEDHHPVDAQNAVRHAMWRQTKTAQLARELAIARAAKDGARRILAGERAKLEALTSLRIDLEQKQLQNDRSREAEGLILQGILRQTS